MWTDDDVLAPSRWRRVRARVERLDLDVLLRWSLVIISISVGLSVVIGVLALAGGLLAQAMSLIARWY